MALMCRIVGHNWQRVNQPLDGGLPYSLCSRCGKRLGRGINAGVEG